MRWVNIELCLFGLGLVQLIMKIHPLDNGYTILDCRTRDILWLGLLELVMKIHLVDNGYTISDSRTSGRVFTIKVKSVIEFYRFLIVILT